MLTRVAFRIFCHSQNLFWSLHQLNVEQIEAPKVPSGMTGGVEYEAMSYAVSRLDSRRKDPADPLGATGISFPPHQCRCIDMLERRRGLHFPQRSIRVGTRARPSRELRAIMLVLS